MRLYNEATKRTAVGYCMHHKHEGNLNAKLVKQHQCIEKTCPFFIKYNNEYWQKKEGECVC